MLLSTMLPFIYIGTHAHATMQLGPHGTIHQASMTLDVAQHLPGEGRKLFASFCSRSLLTGIRNQW